MYETATYADDSSSPSKLLDNYIGKDNLKALSQAIATINAKPGVGPLTRGLVICSCGSTGRVEKSIQLLKSLVELCVHLFQRFIKSNKYTNQ